MSNTIKTLSHLIIAITTFLIIFIAILSITCPANDMIYLFFAIGIFIIGLIFYFLFSSLYCIKKQLDSIDEHILSHDHSTELLKEKLNSIN